MTHRVFEELVKRHEDCQLILEFLKNLVNGIFLCGIRMGKMCESVFYGFDQLMFATDLTVAAFQLLGLAVDDDIMRHYSVYAMLGVLTVCFWQFCVERRDIGDGAYRGNTQKGKSTRETSAVRLRVVIIENAELQESDPPAD